MVGRRALGLILLAGLLAACARPVPAPPPIISGFGAWTSGTGRARPWQHYGIDIRVPVGTPVLAATDGKVLRVNDGPISGLMVTLAHSEDLATSYNHLSEVLVRSGQAVRRGEVIGRSGMTGNASTPHLHFGVCRARGARCGNRIDRGWDDPTRYWVDGNPCFVETRPVPTAGFTYPVPCHAR